YNQEAKKWVANSPTRFINQKIVRRSHALMEYPYGKCTFSEGEATKTYFGALLICFGALAFGLLFSLPPLRWLVKKLIPQGTGPSKKVRESGCINGTLVGVTEAQVSV